MFSLSVRLRSLLLILCRVFQRIGGLLGALGKLGIFLCLCFLSQSLGRLLGLLGLLLKLTLLFSILLLRLRALLGIGLLLCLLLKGLSDLPLFVFQFLGLIARVGGSLLALRFGHCLIGLGFIAGGLIQFLPGLG